MKWIVFFTILFLTAPSRAQTVNALPVGKYETNNKDSNAWNKGNIILTDTDHYKISSGANENTGEYRFSVTAQRVFFTSGPLKGVFARTIVSNGAPAILIPFVENQKTGLRPSADVIARYKK